MSQHVTAGRSEIATEFESIGARSSHWVTKKDNIYKCLSTEEVHNRVFATC